MISIRLRIHHWIQHWGHDLSQLSKEILLFEVTLKRHVHKPYQYPFLPLNSSKHPIGLSIDTDDRCYVRESKGKGGKSYVTHINSFFG